MKSRVGVATIIAALTVAVVVPAVPARAAPYEPPGRTERLLTPDGDQLNGDVFSEPLGMSADGRFVSFSSFASNLVDGDTNDMGDVFVLDRTTGLVERVSVVPGAGSGGSQSSISANGRFVAFTSWSEDLDTRDDNDTYDVFVHDRQTRAIELVSITGDGVQGNLGAEQPAISADGRFVTFLWHARNLPGDTNQTSDVYVHDRETNTTELVSVAHDGAQANGSSTAPSISADGRYVSFASQATNLVPLDTNWAIERRHGSDAFVRDRVEGTIRRVSVASDGTGGNGRVMNPRISADGDVVAFLSGATNLVPQDTNNSFDVFVHDLPSGRTERMAITSRGVQSDQGFAGNFVSMSLSLSADGRYVAFGSTSTNLVEGDGRANSDVFMHDRSTGATERISISTVDPAAGGGNHPAISADGDAVAFVSGAPNIVDDDTNEQTDLFVRDRGPSLGAGEVEVTPEGSTLAVEGWVRFPGEVVSSAVDRDDDAGAVAGSIGGELTGARLLLRPESDDLLVTIDVPGLPSVRPPEAAAGYPTMGGFLVCPDCVVPSVGGVPALVYGVGLDAGDVRYEARVTRIAADGDALGAFSLHRCGPGCERIATLTGGYGTATEDIRISLPLDLFEGLDEVGRARAFALAGDPDSGGFVAQDEVPLAGFAVLDPVVDVGIAPLGTQPEDVVFDVAAELSAGHFSGSIDVSALAPDEYEVWARTCLGEICGAESASVSLGGGPSPSPPVTPTAEPTESPLPDTTAVTFTERSATSGQFSDETLFEGRLVDSADDSIQGAEIAFDLTGAHSSRTFTAITDEDGVASVTATLDEEPGAYQLTARYVGDENRAPSADTIAFVVEKEDTDTDLTVEGRGKNRTLTARLSDRDTPDDGVEARRVDFYADGTFIGSVTTDEGGVAILEAPPRYRGGRHDFVAYFEGDDYFLGSSDRERT